VDVKYDFEIIEDCPFPFLTVINSNGEKHCFTAEAISEWNDALQRATRTWVPPPPVLLSSQPDPIPKRMSLAGPMPVVSVGQLLMRKSTLRASLVVSSNDVTPQDRAIVAWINFCCAKPMITNPATISAGNLTLLFLLFVVPPLLFSFFFSFFCSFFFSMLTVWMKICEMDWP
jgi:hypothetical protein